MPTKCQNPSISCCQKIFFRWSFTLVGARYPLYRIDLRKKWFLGHPSDPSHTSHNVSQFESKWNAHVSIRRWEMTRRLGNCKGGRNLFASFGPSQKCPTFILFEKYHWPLKWSLRACLRIPSSINIQSNIWSSWALKITTKADIFVTHKMNVKIL